MTEPKSVTITLPLPMWKSITRFLRENGYPAHASEIEAQLPKPKPEEPTGLGAVVEEADGTRWVRSDIMPYVAQWSCARPDEPWRSVRRYYKDIAAVIVLSEGVPE